MDFNDSQVNTSEVSTPSGGSDSTPVSSTADTTSSAQPATAESLVDSFLQQSQATPPASDAQQPSGPAEEALSEQKTDVAPSAGSPETKDFGYKTLDEAISDIRGLRENRRTLEPKAKGYDEVVATAEQFGFTPDLIPKGLSVVGNLFGSVEDPETGEARATTVPFLELLETESNPRLAQLLTDSADRYSDYLLSKIGVERALESAGLKPALLDTYRAVQEDGSLEGQTLGGYDPEILATIPADLQVTYKALPLEKQIELDGKSEAARTYELQREKRFADMERSQQEAQEQAKQQALAQIEAQENQRLQSFIAEQETAFFTELKDSFSPFGSDPADADLNEFIHQAIYGRVTNSLNKDPKAAGLLKGLADAARANDSIARQRLLAQVNVHVARHRNAIIERLQQKVFGPSFAQAQATRDQNAKHINVNGTGGFSADRQPDQLPGINSPEYLEALMARTGMR